MGDPPLTDDVRREIESHIDMRAEELIARGWDSDEAWREARRAFGDTGEVERMMMREARSKDRAVRRARAWEGAVQDLRYAWRSLRGDPGFAVLALVTLALGIGANTAIFSVVHGVLVKPLPFPDPHELVWVREWRAERPTGMSVAWPNYRDWRERSRSFDGIAAYSDGTTAVLGGPQPVRAHVADVSLDFWRVFPVRPVQGRLTSSEDHVPGADPVAVVSETFWRTELGGADLSALRLEVYGRQLRVAGVLPADFSYPEGAQIWLPLELEEPGESRTAHNYSVVGRLAGGATAALADEELDRITAAAVEGLEDSEYLAQGALVVPLHERVTGDSRTPLLVLLAAAGLVLATACTNLGTTLLARGTSRSRELAVRASLGAGRGRIVRQLFTESLLLAVLGAAAGLGLAWLLLGALVEAGAASSLPRLGEIGVDGTVLAFTAVVAVATAVLFGLLPALKLARGSLTGALREGDRGSAGVGSGLWRLLIGTEVALALVLLVGSGLLVRSLQQVLGEERGFEAADVLSTQVSLSRMRYEDPGAHAAWYGAFLDDLAGRPGVEAAGLLSALPLGNFVPNGRIELDGDVEKTADAWYVLASEEAFDALDVTLLAGRAFDDALDGPDAPHVAVVNRAFADRYWPDGDAVGRSVTGGGMDNFWEARTFATVVGVVEDVQYRDLTRAVHPTVYFPYTQRPFRLFWGGATVVLESEGEPGPLAPMLREALTRHAPDVPVRIRPMDEVVSASVAERRFLLSVMGGFAALALVLAMIGIYGVVSWTVARRKREMGIRLALGAAPGAVRALVLRRAMGMVAGGLVVGAVAALLVAGVMEGLLYETRPRDPATFATVLLALVAAGLAASWIPAVRSTRVDPAVTMKTE